MGDRSRMLSGNNIDDIGGEFFLGAYQGPGLGVKGLDVAAEFRWNPFDHIPVEAFPNLTHDFRHGEFVFGIQNQDLGPGFVVFHVMGDHGGAFIRRGRATVRPGRRGNGKNSAVRHGIQLPFQGRNLGVGPIGVRKYFGSFFVVTIDQV